MDEKQIEKIVSEGVREALKVTDIEKEAEIETITSDKCPECGKDLTDTLQFYSNELLSYPCVVDGEGNVSVIFDSGNFVSSTDENFACENCGHDFGLEGISWDSI